MAMLQRVKAKFDLPDAEFVVDTSDGYSHMEAPIFVIAKFKTSPGGILYPDFSSYAWPESECPDEPKGSHVWARAVKRIDAAVPEWSQKTDQLLLGSKFISRWWFQCFFFHPYLGKWSNLTNIFQMVWNHQLDVFSRLKEPSAECSRHITTFLFERNTLQGTNIYPLKVAGKMIFLFHRVGIRLKTRHHKTALWRKRHGS